jgi:hypothetical protein
LPTPQKDTHLKHILFSAVAAFFCLHLSAADNWKTYFKNEQAEILYRYSDCHDDANGVHQQKILLKFVNLQNTKMEISFSKELAYNSRKGNSSDIKSYLVELGSKETKEGVCSDKDNALFIFSKQLNLEAKELSGFELKNISVKIIE